MRAACGETFKLLPVYKNALETDSGRASKLASDSLIAAYKLTVLMFRSCTNSATDGEMGSSALVKWAAAANGLNQQRHTKSRWELSVAIITIVENQVRFAPLLAESGKCSGDGCGI